MWTMQAARCLGAALEQRVQAHGLGRILAHDEIRVAPRDGHRIEARHIGRRRQSMQAAQPRTERSQVAHAGEVVRRP